MSGQVLCRHDGYEGMRSGQQSNFDDTKKHQTATGMIGEASDGLVSIRDASTLKTRMPGHLNGLATLKILEKSGPAPFALFTFQIG